MSVPEIDVQTLAAECGVGRRVFDVREPDEFEEVRVPEAVLIPLAMVPEEIEQFEGTDTVYVICQTGSRSRRAVEFLRRNGIDAVNVAGGTLAWVQAGLPTDTGAQ